MSITNEEALAMTTAIHEVTETLKKAFPRISHDPAHFGLAIGTLATGMMALGMAHHLETGFPWQEVENLARQCVEGALKRARSALVSGSISG